MVNDGAARDVDFLDISIFYRVDIRGRHCGRCGGLGVQIVGLYMHYNLHFPRNCAPEDLRSGAVFTPTGSLVEFNSSYFIHRFRDGDSIEDYVPGSCV